MGKTFGSSPLYCLATPNHARLTRATRQRCAMQEDDEFASMAFLTITIFGVVLLCVD